MIFQEKGGDGGLLASRLLVDITDDGVTSPTESSRQGLGP